jgi:hypothetical protein
MHNIKLITSPCVFAGIKPMNGFEILAIAKEHIHLLDKFASM